MSVNLYTWFRNQLWAEHSKGGRADIVNIIWVFSILTEITYVSLVYIYIYFFFVLASHYIPLVVLCSGEGIKFFKFTSEMKSIFSLSEWIKVQGNYCLECSLTSSWWLVRDMLWSYTGGISYSLILDILIDWTVRWRTVLLSALRIYITYINVVNNIMFKFLIFHWCFWFFSFVTFFHFNNLSPQAFSLKQLNVS